MIRLAVTMTFLVLVLTWGAPVAAPAQAYPAERRAVLSTVEPRLLGRLSEAAPALSVAVRGRLAAIGAHARGVHLVDIADPAAGSGRVPLRFGASFMAVASGAVWRRRAAGPRGWPWRRRPARRSA